jgi:hypothetical protein
MMIHVVVFATEYGDDVFARFKHEDALSLAGELISDTVSELEEEIEDKEGIEKIHKLKEHVVEQRFEEAIVAYNDLYDDFMPESEKHHLQIKTVEVE